MINAGPAQGLYPMDRFNRGPARPQASCMERPGCGRTKLCILIPGSWRTQDLRTGKGLPGNFQQVQPIKSHKPRRRYEALSYHHGHAGRSSGNRGLFQYLA